MNESHEEEINILERAIQVDEEMNKKEHTLRLKFMKEEHEVKMQEIIEIIIMYLFL